MDPNVKPLFDYLELFKDISLHDKEIIDSKIKIRNVKEGEILLKEGELAKEMFFITNGILKIITVNEKGNFVVLFFLKENQFCTILNSFNNNTPSTESIVAACDTSLIVFPNKIFYTYMIPFRISKT